MTSLDDVLYSIASEIESLVDAKGDPPPPVKPRSPVVDPNQLAADSE